MNAFRIVHILTVDPEPELSDFQRCFAGLTPVDVTTHAFCKYLLNNWWF